ncbi:hypothetical protein [uncultured Amphritea sp.]|uniref:hypothetical protein n=1 Tax=uncultured Amphritea sp. TaxID=981605 RepID=UPI00262C7D62|nr:hypothetical protein [uncultured Amphritea sp.]
MTSDHTPIGASKITGAHIEMLNQRFDMFALQPLLGIYQAKITQAVSKKHIDTPISDVTRCLVIRALLEKPELAPLPVLKDYDDLIEALKNAPEGFPFPTTQSNSGVLFGRSISTVNGLKKGRPVTHLVAMWITLFLDQFDSLCKKGTKHPLYKIMEEEAAARGLSLQSIIFNRGWPKATYDTPASINGAEMMTGEHLKRFSETVTNYDYQSLMGLYLAKSSQLTSKRNRKLPVADAARGLMLRTLLKHPEWAPRAKLYHFEDLMNAYAKLPSSFPLPTAPTYLGVTLGRSSSTVHGLRNGRKEMMVLTIWITILLNCLPELKAEKEEHFLYKILEDEAKSRGHSLQEIIYNRGWPTDRE